LPTVTPAEPYLLTDDQVHAALQYVHPSPTTQARRRALVWIGMAAGLRRSEVGPLRLRDLDSETSTLVVSHPAKHGVSRRIPLPENAWKPTGFLQTWIHHRPAPVTGPDWLWTTQYG